MTIEATPEKIALEGQDASGEAPATGQASPPVATPVADTAGAGIPSEHQDHALNLMSETIQPQFDRFKSWSDNIATEINARTSKFETERAAKVTDFNAMLDREAAAHDGEIAGLRSLQGNVALGLKVLTDAAQTYAALAKPVGRDLTKIVGGQQEPEEEP